MSHNPTVQDVGWQRSRLSNNARFGTGGQSGIDEARAAGCPTVGTGLAVGAVAGSAADADGPSWSIPVSVEPSRCRQDRLSVACGAIDASGPASGEIVRRGWVARPGRIPHVRRNYECDRSVEGRPRCPLAWIDVAEGT